MPSVTLIFPTAKRSSGDETYDVGIRVSTRKALSETEVNELNNLLISLKAVYHVPSSPHQETAEMSIYNKKTYSITPYSDPEYNKCITADDLLTQLRAIPKPATQATAAPHLVTSPQQPANNPSPENQSKPWSWWKF